MGAAVPLFAGAAELLERNTERLLSDVGQRFGEAGSPDLLRGSRQMRRMMQAARVILAATVEALRHTTALREIPLRPVEAGSYAACDAVASLSPAESFKLACVLADAAFSLLLSELSSSQPPAKIGALSLAVQRSAMVPILGSLSTQLQAEIDAVSNARASERAAIGHRINNELANTIASVAHSIELYDLLKRRHSTEADRQLDIASQVARGALAEARTVANELSAELRPDGLEATLTEALRDAAPETDWVEVSVVGGVELSRPVQKEVAALVYELAHALSRWVVASRIELFARTGPTGLLVRLLHEPIAGNEAGDTSRHASAATEAIEAVKQRARILRGTLSSTPSASKGIEITLDVPVIVRPSGTVTEFQHVSEASILCADEHEPFRRSIVDALRAGWQGVRISSIHETTTDAETLAGAERWRPDLILLDLDLPFRGASKLLPHLLSTDNTPKVVVLSMRDDTALGARLLRQGATAYVAKSASLGELRRAIFAALHGQRSVVLALPAGTEGRGVNHPDQQLSSREKEVLALVSKGLSNAQIASRLHISEGTVKKHLANVYGKLNVGNRKAAVRAVGEQGMYDYRRGWTSN